MTAKILGWPVHLPHRCAAGCEGCMFCEGGLMLCTRCGGAEASLPTDCPGEQMWAVALDDVQDNRLNYLRGRGFVCEPVYRIIGVDHGRMVDHDD